MTDRYQPVSIDVEKERAVTLTFGDGFVASLPIEELRASCPCAVCRDRRSGGEEAWSAGDHAEPLVIRDVRLVGGWGLGFLWSDGHDTGIFPFELLRRWREDEGDSGS